MEYKISPSTDNNHKSGRHVATRTRVNMNNKVVLVSCHEDKIGPVMGSIRFVIDHSKMMESKNVRLHNTLHFMKCFQMYRLFYLNYSMG